MKEKKNPLAPGARRAHALIVATAAAILLILAGQAAASHYRLPAAGLITEAEHSALKSAGVDTTLALYERAAKLADRDRLQEATGIAPERLDELAALCDLLRIEGVGPKMARLLSAAGVSDAAALAKEKPAALIPRMEAANATNRVSEILPDEAIVTGWIALARRLPRRLEHRRTR